MDDFDNIERLLEDIKFELTTSSVEANTIELSTYVGMIYAHILNPQNTAEQDYKTYREIVAKFDIWRKQLHSQKCKASKYTDNTTASKTKKTATKKKVAVTNVSKDTDQKDDLPC